MKNTVKWYRTIFYFSFKTVSSF